LLLVVFLLCAFQLWGQTPSTAQAATFQVSAAQPWTDTGIDLQSGDSVEISAAAASGSGACDPKGVSAPSSDLPLPSAPAGALIARLHAQGAVPLLVGAGTELQIEESSHLFVGMNMAGTAPCQGTLAVKVRKIPAGSATASATSAGTSGAQPKTRGQQLKSQLASAAQVFMSGQFGMGKSEVSPASNATSGSTADASSAVPALKVSDAPLEADLRKSLDGLPRRVNDQFHNLGDMVNFVIVGNQKDVQSALEAATWHIADTDNKKAVLNALMETYENKDYLAMPMSTLYLFGRKQDFGYEMAEPIAMVASRHHFRIWKSPITWKGQEVWVGAGTHDIGFAKDKRNNDVTHKIDPAVDGERDNIGASLQKANKAKTLSYYLPANPVQDAKNATGDGYHSDGRLLVIFLQ
ncbi:MAG TPA: LssY C-terminal domain-containing protein, partial [Alphaproteobacteria bacterium]|nr:LssY C-terminal domain-containing protein [Alphaproteobacteria bacterium]